ncbi:MAG: hypothetical protein ABJJ69_05465 [Paracoccaceae bacterium]
MRAKAVFQLSKQVAIKTLCEGDMVVARDEDTGQSGVFPVSTVIKSQTIDVL